MRGRAGCGRRERRERGAVGRPLDPVAGRRGDGRPLQPDGRRSLRCEGEVGHGLESTRAPRDHHRVSIAGSAHRRDPKPILRAPRKPGSRVTRHVGRDGGDLREGDVVGRPLDAVTRLAAGLDPVEHELGVRQRRDRRLRHRARPVDGVHDRRGSRTARGIAGPHPVEIAHRPSEPGVRPRGHGGCRRGHAREINPILRDLDHIPSRTGDRLP